MQSNYEYNWKWGVVIGWTGIKGVFSLLFAPDIHNLAEEKIESPQMFIFYVQVLSLMTMGINSYMMTHCARTLGLSAISLPRQMAMQNAIKHIHEIIQNTITLFKTEKILTNVNWTLVEEKVKIKYSTSSDSVPFYYVSQDEKEESPTDEVLIEEARLHVAMIQMSSFEKQCKDGILGVEAARILIGATKSYCPIQGKFLKMFSIVFQHLIYTFFGIIIGCGETKYFDFHTVVFMVILFVTVNFVRISQGCSLYKTFSRNVASADSEGTASNSAALPRRKDAWTISVSPQPGSSRAG